MRKAKGAQSWKGGNPATTFQTYSTLSPAPLFIPLKMAKIPISELRQSTGLCHFHRADLSLCPVTTTTAAPVEGYLLSAWTQCKVLPWEPWVLPPGPHAARGMLGAWEAAISQSSCYGWVMEQVCSSSSQGHDSESVTHWPCWCNAIINFVVLHRDGQAAFPTGHIRPPRRWGVAVWEERQAAPRGCQGLCRQGWWWEDASSAAVPLHSWPSHPPLLPSAATAWFYVTHAERCVFFQWRTRKQAGNKILLERQLAGRSQTASGSKSS